jgi:hypothetical protein
VGEKDDLLGFLGEQRRAVVKKVEGLTDDQARRTVVPSGWTPLAVVHHLRLGEQYWTDYIMQGIGGDPDSDDATGRSSWDPPSDLTVATAIDQYRDACRHTDEFVARAASLDIPAVRLPAWKQVHHWARSLRTVLLHLIEETARHAGHLDIARELLEERHVTERR